MAIKAGPAPWSEGYKRATKNVMSRQGVEWSLSSGYRQWSEQPKKPKTKTVRLYNGRTVEVPDADFEDFIGHHVSPDSDPYSEIGKYIDKAFENMDRIQDVEGVGHITYIEYSPTYQLLRVEFRDGGAVVVFFRVPKEVYSELKYLAESKAIAISTTDGKQRHVLGMRFWDIVRIRGQREGSKYRYEYLIHNEYSSRGTVSDRALKDVTTKLDIDDNELIETLRAFTRRLTPDAKRIFDNLTTSREMYSFLRKHNIDLPTYEELTDPDF